MDSHAKLARHLSHLAMGFPERDVLVEILQENVTAEEAELLCHLPTGVVPMASVPPREVADAAGLAAGEVADRLEDLAARGLLHSGPTLGGETGYSLLQVGYGFPQTFFWKGEDTPHARRMADRICAYFGREVTREAYAGSQTKPYRYVPVERSIRGAKQAVAPHDRMEELVRGARRFALAHCPCRMTARLRGRDCGHPTEVCLKFDEMADYLIARGLGREVSEAEALDVVRRSEEAGLVHFVDNAEGRILHNCNCCGCACWNVGSIRRRKIPRDVLMATYFLRETDPEACVACGACAEVCPVDAVSVVDGEVRVDEEWCIGCGVCAGPCPSDAVSVRPRADGPAGPAADVHALHLKILEEKQSRRG